MGPDINKIVLNNIKKIVICNNKISQQTYVILQKSINIIFILTTIIVTCNLDSRCIKK